MTIDEQISEELESARKFAELGKIQIMHASLYRMEHLYHVGHPNQELDQDLSAQRKEIEELGYKTAIKEYLANNNLPYQ